MSAREAVEATPRGAMTKARRLRLWVAHEGRCGGCRCKVPLDGTVMDHFIQLWLGGADADEQIRPLCDACDKPKTAKDATIRAKVKRIIARADGTRKPRKAIPSRPFGPSRPFPSRRSGETART